MEDFCCFGIQVGQKVPDFEMETYEPSKGDFGKMSLADQKKKKKWTVLFFYPADFTFVWATEFAALAERYDELKKLGAEVYTVSADTKFVHLAWKNDERMLKNAKFPMASDPTGEIARLFGVYLEDEGLALRGTFVINPEGTLMNTEVNFLNLGRNIEDLVRRLRANIYLAKNTVEACPAQWNKPGDTTLTPSASMVGHVAEAMEGKPKARKKK